MTHILAGDVGGTNTRLAIYELGHKEPVFAQVAPSGVQSTLEQVVRQFLDEAAVAVEGLAIERACLGVAGPVENNACRATNLPWTVDGRRLGERLSIDKFLVVNDFEAMARSVPELDARDVRRFGGGAPELHGPIVVLGPGTGLGHAFLIWCDSESRYRVVPSEGGHADFAPRTEMEGALLDYLSRRHGHVSNERVLCGQGLVDMISFLDGEASCQETMTEEIRAALGTENAPAVISNAAVTGSDPVCRLALAMFTGVLGAVAGNLALLLLAKGGVFIGGGIAPRIGDFLAGRGCREAFEDKGRFRPLLQEIPLSLITREEPGLLGAAMYAAEL